MPRRVIGLDYETRSTIDLVKSGVHPYVESDTTEIMCVRWRDITDHNNNKGPLKGQRFDADPQRRLDPELHALMADPEVEFTAWNAAFEDKVTRFIGHARHGWPYVAMERWRCTQGKALAMALPPALGDASPILGGPRKNLVGHKLMMKLCKPTNMKAVQALDAEPIWAGSDEDFQTQFDYCGDDVLAEGGMHALTPPWLTSEVAVWQMNERINDRGVLVDQRFVRAAMRALVFAKARLDRRMRKVTGGAVKTTNSLPSLKAWALSRGLPADPMEGLEEGADAPAPGDDEEADAAKFKLDGDAINAYLTRFDLPADVREALEIRRMAGKASVGKFQAILNRLCKDGRVRGAIVYHRASTGRFAGAGIQTQNMPRGCPEEAEYELLLLALDDVWDAASDIIAAGAEATFDDIARRKIERDQERDKTPDMKRVEGSTLVLLSKMMRGFIIAAPGKKLIWSDYAAVEARGVAWLSGAAVALQAFAEDGPIYEIMAAAIFGRKITKKDVQERFLGKQVVLGCGYGMGWPKFIAHCLKLGVKVSEEMAQLAVETWRSVNHETKAYWYAMGDAALAATRAPGSVIPVTDGKIKFRHNRGHLEMRLPSGRVLYYFNARVEYDEGFERDSLVFDGWNAVTKKWGKERTWGGKLTENAVQAICRDLLVYGQQQLEEAGYPLVMHVHDENIAETPDEDRWTPDEMAAIMSRLPPWAAGFPLKAEAHQGYRYGK